MITHSKLCAQIHDTFLLAIVSFGSAVRQLTHSFSTSWKAPTHQNPVPPLTGRIGTHLIFSKPPSISFCRASISSRSQFTLTREFLKYSAREEAKYRHMAPVSSASSLAYSTNAESLDMSETTIPGRRVNERIRAYSVSKLSHECLRHGDTPKLTGSHELHISVCCEL